MPATSPIRRLSSTLAHSSPENYASQLLKARKNCAANLQKYDKSSHVLSAYVPEPVRDTFLAIKCFQLEMSKIQKESESMKAGKSSIMRGMGLSSSDLKLKFWQESLRDNVFDSEGKKNDKAVNEPIVVLLKDSVNQGFNLELSYFDQIISTRRDFLKRGSFRNVDELSSYGEGYHSQFNYLLQNLLLSEQLSPSTILLVEESELIRDLLVEIMAHIGQATGIASIVIGSKYYATNKNSVYLPVELMSKFDVSQEDCLRLFQGHLNDDVKDLVTSKLKDVVYETSIVSNDHLLTARTKYAQLREEINKVLTRSKDSHFLERAKKWKNGVPDCIFVPFMMAIPLDGFLKQLEKNDFNIFDKNIENTYWKLVWNSYWSYSSRKF